MKNCEMLYFCLKNRKVFILIQKPNNMFLATHDFTFFVIKS